MRIGENPEKTKGNRIQKKYHRIIMVFFIPEVNHKESYYSSLGNILDISINSLINSINLDTTNITLINNASSASVSEIIEKYKQYIDKYVIYNKNKGKVNAVVNEARGVYEEFLTITDADILFYPGWEKASIELFRDFNNVGAVSPYPFPYAPFYVNKSTFGYNTILGKIAYGKYIENNEIDLYLKGTNLPNIIYREEGFENWRNKHFVLKHRNRIAVLGSYHVVGTYRSFLFKNENGFPNQVFKNQYEEKFIDCLADKKGYIRLSTLKSYIYHMGNVVDDVAYSWRKIESSLDKIDKSVFESLIGKKQNSKWDITLNRILGHFSIKYKWKKIK